MDYEITIEAASSITLAAVRAIVPVNGIATAWKPALDEVWTFLRNNPVPNTGLNVFLYHHPERPGESMKIDFGVQVSNHFETNGYIQCVETPSGEVVQTVHIGPYSRLRDAHAAIHRWCKTNDRMIASFSWEVYWHWNNDPDKLTTTIRYLLA